MSSGQKAVYEDEEEWDAFVREKGLTGMTMFSSNPYSIEAYLAQEGYRNHKLTGSFLAQYVKATMEYSKAKLKYLDTVRHLKQLQKDIKKLESDLAGDASVRSKRSGV
jgi:hypothetical protein